MKPIVFNLEPVNESIFTSLPKRTSPKYAAIAHKPIITERLTPKLPENVPVDYVRNEHVLRKVATDYVADQAFNHRDRNLQNTLPIRRPYNPTIDPTSEIEDSNVLDINIDSNDSYNVYENQLYKRFDESTSSEVGPTRPVSRSRYISPPRLLPKSQRHTHTSDIDSIEIIQPNVYQPQYPQANNHGCLRCPHSNAPFRSIEPTYVKYNSPPRPAAPIVPALPTPTIPSRPASPINPSKLMRHNSSVYPDKETFLPHPHPIPKISYQERHSYVDIAADKRHVPNLSETHFKHQDRQISPRILAKPRQPIIGGSYYQD